MPYLGKSMSVNAAIAHKKGLLPLSRITTTVLQENHFTYPRVFFFWLCKQGYFRPAEYHHTSVAKRMTRYYDPVWIRFIAGTYDLDNLYSLYRRKKTRLTIKESQE